ncbi:MAG: glycosyltransferase family 1 protein, partial [Candidatus Veblenbacteria bacterium]|nr:glycosyltransferase family 1 protein [Candidatus Veblenbacteria bacterium]
MRLGVDIRCLQDRWRTGVGEYVWQTLKVLSTDPSLHLRGFANAAGRIDLPPGLERVVEIHRSRVPNKFMNLKQFWRLGQPIDELARARSEPLDIFWLPNPGFAFLSGRRPAVLTVHDLAFMHFPELFPHRGRLWYFPAVKRLLTQGLPPRSLVAAVSQHTADDVAHCFPVLRERIRVVPPGLDARYLEAPTAEACGQVRQRYGLPAQYLLSLGTVEPRKNYALLVAAYEEIVRQNKNYPYDLVIAGAWGWRTASLRRLLARLTSRGRIHFIGYVPDEDKPALYAQAKLF